MTTIQFLKQQLDEFDKNRNILDNLPITYQLRNLKTKLEFNLVPEIIQQLAIIECFLKSGFPTPDYNYNNSKTFIRLYKNLITRLLGAQGGAKLELLKMFHDAELLNPRFFMLIKQSQDVVAMKKIFVLLKKINLFNENNLNIINSHSDKNDLIKLLGYLAKQELLTPSSFNSIIQYPKIPSLAEAVKYLSKTSLLKPENYNAVKNSVNIESLLSIMKILFEYGMLEKKLFNKLLVFNKQFMAAIHSSEAKTAFDKLSKMDGMREYMYFLLSNSKWPFEAITALLELVKHNLLSKKQLKLLARSDSPTTTARQIIKLEQHGLFDKVDSSHFVATELFKPYSAKYDGRVDLICELSKQSDMHMTKKAIKVVKHAKYFTTVAKWGDWVNKLKSNGMLNIKTIGNALNSREGFYIVSIQASFKSANLLTEENMRKAKGLAEYYENNTLHYVDKNIEGLCRNGLLSQDNFDRLLMQPRLNRLTCTTLILLKKFKLLSFQDFFSFENNILAQTEKCALEIMCVFSDFVKVLPGELSNRENVRCIIYHYGRSGGSMNHCLLKMKEASEDLTQAKFDAFMAFMERKPNATAKQIEQFSNSLDSGNENNQEMSRNHLNLRQ